MTDDALHLDIETFSECDLRAEGVYRYAAHPSTEVLCMGYAFNDELIQVWLPGQPLPVRLVAHIEAGGVVMAFNAQFERVVLNGVAGQKINFPKISIEQTRCSMAKARVHGLPGSLGEACKALGTFPKQSNGHGAMMQLSKPRNHKTEPRFTPENSPKKYAQLYYYCKDDVEAERDLDRNVPDLTPEELENYRLDQRINERGWKIDRKAIGDVLFLVETYKAQLAERCHAITGLVPTQNQKLAEWIRANGYPQLPNLQAPTVGEILQDDNCPSKIKEVLRCYSAYNMKAVTKLNAMLRAASDTDDRLRGMFMFYGAGPGRWSSRLVALQNILRSLIKDPDVAIAAAAERSLGYLQWLYPDIDPMKVLGSCVRGMLIADDGKKLMAFDFSQIESRIQAWLADAEWKLRMFRENKFKIYNIDGAMMFGCKPEEVVDDGENQVYTAAKIGSLACGYQGWAVAIEKFARQMGVELTMDPAEIAGKWREANSEIVQLWYDLNETAQYAVQQPGKAFALRNKKIMFKVIGRWLYMRLPSGRRIAYLDPQVNEAGEVSYMGVDTNTRRWMRVTGYGGRWLQNACEGIGRDLLVNGLLHMEAAGYTTIGSVHDEGVFEVDEGFGSDEEAERLMTAPLAWADGLPVKCGGFSAKRYRK